MPYAAALVRATESRVSSDLTPEATARVAAEAFRYHARSVRSLRFQRYYFETVANRERFLQSTDFFATFKTRYSLQGIDAGFLARLEAQKSVILDRADVGDLAGVYRDLFARAQIQYKDGAVTRNLGSFFSKLIHTLRPAEYCALDNPVKDYLGLKSEGFFVSFMVVSAAYREWAKDNPVGMATIRQAFVSTPTLSSLGASVTDLKLLDLIFWQRADQQKRRLVRKRTEARASEAGRGATRQARGAG